LLSAFAATLVMLHAAPALAQAPKTWVSHFGNDGHGCSPGAPCLTFRGALTKTAAGGEIGVIDPGDYGPVTISQAINITNDGVGEAGILAPSTNGITIDATAGDVVSLRGLVLDGQGSGFAGQGILIQQASAVHVQNCVIRNFQGDSFAIAFVPSGNSQFFVSNTIVLNNGSIGPTGGIAVQPAGTGSANVVLDRIHLENNVVAVWVDGGQSAGNGAHVVIRNGTISGNAGDGIRATTQPGRAPAFVIVEHSSSVNNAGVGIRADGPRATILLNDNTITRKGRGMGGVNSGQLISYGNNEINNNLGSDGAPTGSFRLF